MSKKRDSNPFYKNLEEHISQLGGMFNAHLHLDRVATLDEKYMSSSDFRILENSYISLQKKHSLINSLHAGPAYDADDLRQRVNTCLDEMIAVNTRRADTMVDVTADNIGLKAMEILGDIKAKRADEIDLRLAAYSPFGFVDAEPQRWEIFVEGVEMADFIGALPEADDTDDYPEHIGFEEHCKRVLKLASDYSKPVHVHTDQRNEPSECGTERLIRVIQEHGAPVTESDEPMVWAVHMISPSTYDEARFERLIEGLLKYNIGVICCPSAALGMRQLRPIQTPTYNSIPRVLELLQHGVHVRLASDNIADICSPSTTSDLTDEIFILSASIRFYKVEILAKLAAGQALSEQDITSISEHLGKDAVEVEKAMQAFRRRTGT